MEPNKTNIREFMIAGQSGTGCFISPEESARWAKDEGIYLDNNSSSKPQSSSSLSEEDDNESYIIIVCAEDADPKYNKIQPRTNSAKPIELYPGVNKLSVRDYPALKYGFRQIENYCLPEDENDSSYEYNCGGVLSIDLSHFDASEVTDMSHMFERMENLSQINYGPVKFMPTDSMENAFEWTGREDDILDLSNINLSDIYDTSQMLYGTGFGTVNLTNCDLSNVDCACEMFHLCGAKRLILDGSRLSGVVIEALEDEAKEFCSLEVVSLKGYDLKTVYSVLSALLVNRPDNWPIKVILDENLDYRIEASENGTKRLRVSINPEKKMQRMEWMQVNPGKTERDWLLEERCTTDVQRESLNELLDCCDAFGVKYEIGHTVNLEDEYANMMSKDSHLYEFSESVRVSDSNGLDLTNYKQFISRRFDDRGIEYIQYHSFDLYFPTIGWVFNIGKEIADIINHRWSVQVGPTYYERTGCREPCITDSFAQNLLETIQTKYSFPKSERRGNQYEGYFHYLLPWNTEVKAKADNEESDLLKRNLKPGIVPEFWSLIFGDKFSDMKNYRKERYLNAHPDIKEQRANMLHSLVVELQKRLGLKTVTDFQISRLLGTVDNELAVLYPAYGSIIHLNKG